MSAGGAVLPEAELLLHHVGEFTWDSVPVDDRVDMINLDDVIAIDEIFARENP